MRLALVVLLTTSGCWGPPVTQTAECRAWVACVQATDARAGETTNLDRFVEGGFCWNNSELAEGCTTACARALTRSRARESSLPAECLP